MKRFASILLAAAAMLLGACTQIDTGNVGVERTMGKVNPEALPVGVYFTMFKTVDEFTTKEVSFSLQNLTPKSRDNLTMKDVDIDVYFKTAPAAVPTLFTKYQGDVVKHSQVVEGGSSDLVIAYSRVSREAREAIYKAFASFDATTMHTKRAELAEAVRAELQKELESTDKGAFVITAVNVRNLLTDEAIEGAIRARAQTDQAIEKMRKDVELAKAEAERNLVTVRAQAEQRQVAAEAEAKANRTISESLTPALKEIRIAEMQRDAIIAGSTKAGNTVIVGAPGTTPFIGAK